jgi:hypothetical protein
MTLHDHREDVDGVEVDPEALLVALVLVPHSYPRNRFYDMFRRPVAARTRRRASLLRSLIADLLEDASDVTLQRISAGYRLRYSLPELGITRRTLLDEDEIALIALVASRENALRLPPCFEGITIDVNALARVRQRLERLFR